MLQKAEMLTSVRVECEINPNRQANEAQQVAGMVSDYPHRDEVLAYFGI
jgi:hypothetical protein